MTTATKLPAKPEKRLQTFGLALYGDVWKTALSNAMHVHKRTMSYWLAGHTPPDLDERQVPRPSAQEMADIFNTTASAIQTVLSRKGLIRNAATTGAAWKNEKRPRNCICCRKPFVSEGSHNRQCPVCYAANSEMAA